jgi:hypothetical protein
MPRYREIGLDAPDAEPMQFWSSDTQDSDIAAWLATRDGESWVGDADGGGYSSESGAAWLSPSYEGEEPAS